jgi:TPR repeat protein
VERSHEGAVKWFRKAAEQGHAWAQCNLANCYYNGKGVEQSYEEAMKWFRKAAEQGHADAQLFLVIYGEE